MKIVLTGGPSAGKTSVVNVLYQTDRMRFAIVQEAASVLFRGGFPRSSRPLDQKCQQRAIYFVQRELEEIGQLESQGRSLVCDRGTLDGVAYWPGDEASYLAAVGSSMAEEIHRYDWVLHMDTASPSHYQNSEIRTELSAQAELVNQRVKQAWRLHPRRIVIPNFESFLEKIDVATKAVRMILDGKSLEQINAALLRPVVP